MYNRELACLAIITFFLSLVIFTEVFHSGKVRLSLGVEAILLLHILFPPFRQICDGGLQPCRWKIV